MNKKVKILVNIAIFILVVGFVWMMIASLKSDGKPSDAVSETEQSAPFTSPCHQLYDIPLSGPLNRFELKDDKLFVTLGDSVCILTSEGVRVAAFKVSSDSRDITVDADEIFLLYPTSVKVYSFTGELKRSFEACSDNSAYCSIAVSGDHLFVTDAQNKNICKYTREGSFVKFIESPREFVVPHYSFDIDIWNDTVYCVNPGRHLIESYTLEGDFIKETGGPDGKDGFFSGCSNPSYIAFTPYGTMLASDQGKPRISLYDRSGNNLMQLFNAKNLGVGTEASEIKADKGLYFLGGKNRIVVYQKEKRNG